MVTLSNELRKARKEHTCSYCCLTISKAEVYNRSGHVYDGHKYTWKNHLFCSKIANELNMWDWVDEGVTEEDFHQSIQDAYATHMSRHFNEIWESDDFELPEFKDQLIFMLDLHKVEHTLEKTIQTPETV